jgi:tetratricopeptide (TPR) repeat protein
LTGTLLNNIGVAYDNLGEPERALPYLADALIKLRAAQNRPGEVNTLNTLGAALRKLGKLDRALALHREALKLARDKLHDATQQAISRQRCAEIDLDRGDTAAALRELDEAARLEKVDLQTRTRTLSLRGRALIRAGRMREAVPILQEVLARRQAVRDRAGEADTLDELAVADRSLGLAAEARAYAKEALERVEGLRTGLASPDLRASFLATRRRAFALLIELLMDHSQASMLSSSGLGAALTKGRRNEEEHGCNGCLRRNASRAGSGGFGPEVNPGAGSGPGGGLRRGLAAAVVRHPAEGGRLRPLLRHLDPRDVGHDLRIGRGLHDRAEQPDLAAPEHRQGAVPELLG